MHLVKRNTVLQVFGIFLLKLKLLQIFNGTVPTLLTLLEFWFMIYSFVPEGTDLIHVNAFECKAKLDFEVQLIGQLKNQRYAFDCKCTDDIVDCSML